LQECTKLTNDNSKLVSEVKKLSADKEKDTADRSRLESENASVTEEKKKLLATLQTAKQRLVALRTDKETLESTCAELKQQLEAAAAEKESSQLPANEPSTGRYEFCSGIFLIQVFGAVLSDFMYCTTDFILGGKATFFKYGLHFVL